MCKMMTPLRPFFFFSFFKILIYLVGRRVKGQKMTQNDKNYLSQSIHFFQNPDFVGCLVGWGEGKREKYDP